MPKLRLVDIQDLPVGTPLETRLSPLKRRRGCNEYSPPPTMQANVESMNNRQTPDESSIMTSPVCIDGSQLPSAGSPEEPTLVFSTGGSSVVDTPLGSTKQSPSPIKIARGQGGFSERGCSGSSGRGANKARRGNEAVKSMAKILRPSTLEPLRLMHIKDLPIGSPLENPLSALKKKRGHNSTPPISQPPIPKVVKMDIQEEELEEQESVNCGSEDETDSDDDEDDEILPPFLGIPRIAQMLMNTPEDAEAESVPDPSWTSDPFYNFEWRQISEPPVPPEKRRETFACSKCGPTISSLDPYDIFVSIWDQAIMETIASETNRYARQLLDQVAHSGKIREWNDTTPAELYVYFGLILAMGVVVKGRVNDYWSSDCPSILDTPGFGAIMSKKRFHILSRCLHFIDNQDLAGQDLSASEAKVMKIKPVTDHLNKKFQSLYKLNHNIALDKCLLQWNGLLNMDGFIPNQASMNEIKSHEVWECQTGYLWRFLVQTSSTRSNSVAAQDPLSRSTPTLVLQLLRGLEYKGHTVWMDSFYNSPVLARKLKTLGFDCVGTLRTNRPFVPLEFKETSMTDRNIVGLTSGDVDVIVWEDRYRVSTISTYHGSAVCTVENGNVKPVLIDDYNIMMLGIDKKDLLLSTYPIERKRTKVWYKTLFRRLLNVSVLNAYIIYKQNINGDPLTHRDFRMQLIGRLLDHNASVPSEVKQVFDVREHYLSLYDYQSLGYGRKQRPTRTCFVCRKTTTMFCVGCDKPACALKCFRDLHQ